MSFDPFVPEPGTPPNEPIDWNAPAALFLPGCEREEMTLGEAVEQFLDVPPHQHCGGTGLRASVVIVPHGSRVNAGYLSWRNVRALVGDPTLRD